MAVQDGLWHVMAVCVFLSLVAAIVVGWVSLAFGLRGWCLSLGYQVSHQFSSGRFGPLIHMLVPAVPQKETNTDNNTESKHASKRPGHSMKTMTCSDMLPKKSATCL